MRSTSLIVGARLEEALAATALLDSRLCFLVAIGMVSLPLPDGAACRGV
jgi:hypothetical protein